MKNRRFQKPVDYLGDEIYFNSSPHIEIASPEQSQKRATKAREMRLRQRGGALCGVCRGTRYSRPDTVCGRCLGRGFVIPREVSTGSWFEPENKPLMAFEDLSRQGQISRMRGRPSGTGRSLRKAE